MLQMNPANRIATTENKWDGSVPAAGQESLRNYFNRIPGGIAGRGW
jgi:hypothetical protein